MTRKRKTRVPSGKGGPKSLRSTRKEDKATTLEGARRVLDELLARELELNQKNWDEVRAELEPPTCSWRSTYRNHVKHLFEAHRPPRPEDQRVSAADHANLEGRLAKAMQCIAERDAEIARLRARIGVLEAANGKLSMGTRERRRR